LTLFAPLLHRFFQQLNDILQSRPPRFFERRAALLVPDRQIRARINHRSQRALLKQAITTV
jgi:hypothetical protein